MSHFQLLGRVTLVGLALIGLATCGGDSGGSSPTTPAAPAPAPLTPLSWLDVPTDVVTLRVGETRVVNLRLSAAIEASATVAYVESQVAVEGVNLRPGVVQLTITGVGPGEDTIDLVAEAPGYQTAEASFSVRVEEALQIGRIDSLVEVFVPLAFREVFDLEVVAGLLVAPDLSGEETLDAIDEYLVGLDFDAWGWFDDGDVIEWDGEERLLVFSEVPAIRVWGTPYADIRSRFARSQWWVLKWDTTFLSIESGTSAERFHGALREKGVGRIDVLRKLRN